nr:hypothetical protein [Gammaproteobacteria bacterium]
MRAKPNIAPAPPTLLGGDVQLAAQGVEQIGLRLGRLYLALLLLIFREGPRWPEWPGKREI